MLLELRNNNIIILNYARVDVNNKYLHEMNVIFCNLAVITTNLHIEVQEKSLKKILAFHICSPKSVEIFA